MPDKLRINKLLFYILFTLFPCFVFSAYIGNPSSPALLQEGVFFSDKWPVNCSLSFDATKLFNDKDKFKPTWQEEGFQNAKMKGETYIASVVLTILERLDCYAGVGIMHMHPSFKRDGYYYKGRSKSHPACRLGAKILLFEVNNFSFGADVKYLTFHFRTTDFTVNPLPPEEEEYKLNLTEWQIALGISYQVKWFSPYIGLDVRNMEILMKDTDISEKGRIKMINRHKTGVYCGFSFVLTTSLSITAEARFVSEQAVTVQIRRRF